eukprot:Filipodium_phascolosomae@DN1231_c0_g1_i1.p1
MGLNGVEVVDVAVYESTKEVAPSTPQHPTQAHEMFSSNTGAGVEYLVYPTAPAQSSAYESPCKPGKKQKIVAAIWPPASTLERRDSAWKLLFPIRSPLFSLACVVCGLLLYSFRIVGFVPEASVVTLVPFTLFCLIPFFIGLSIPGCGESIFYVLANMASMNAISCLVFGLNFWYGLSVVVGPCIFWMCMVIDTSVFERDSVWKPMRIATYWLVVSFLQSSLVGLFASVSVGMYAVPFVIQVVEIVGIWGLEWCLACLSAGIAFLVTSRDVRNRYLVGRIMGLGLTMWMFICCALHVRVSRSPRHEIAISVCAFGSPIKGNSQGARSMVNLLNDCHFESLDDATGERSRMLVIPEGSIDLRFENLHNSVQWIKYHFSSLAQTLDTYIVAGVTVAKDSSLGLPSNAIAVAVDPRGNVISVNSKYHNPRSMMIIGKNKSGFSSGIQLGVIKQNYLAGWYFYPHIRNTGVGFSAVLGSDVDFFPLYDSGASLIVQPSRDSFKARMRYGISVLRAIESRKSIVKADMHYGASAISGGGTMPAHVINSKEKNYKYPKNMHTRVPIGDGRPTMAAVIGPLLPWICMATIIYFIGKFIYNVVVTRCIRMWLERKRTNVIGETSGLPESSPSPKRTVRRRSCASCLPSKAAKEQVSSFGECAIAGAIMSIDSYASPNRVIV